MNQRTEPYQEEELGGIACRIAMEFIEQVLERRSIKPELIHKAQIELAIFFDRVIIERMSGHFCVSTIQRVSKQYLKQLSHEMVDKSITYHDVIRLCSIRHGFYCQGLNESPEEDFLRTVSMQWFQFPMQQTDGSIRPLEFDFTYYFSDIPLTSEVLFDLGPKYADRIVQELKVMKPSMVSNGPF
ncbi:hypothetical protein N6H18_09020 [Reichenbachiella agarivorans]|uniref:Uncharacterized protein n=1 Tax=Reichenbachiella agarivorans TaxID=2979464 RepID=A0ABY6CUS0_9BACT|nr:hypothetical protein [Reichenbachiella agarivorans]UXP34084.1 hypothetical protein N6H18_09020 [Reichenbachiella agarivorans]